MSSNVRATSLHSKAMSSKVTHTNAGEGQTDGPLPSIMAVVGSSALTRLVGSRVGDSHIRPLLTDNDAVHLLSTERATFRSFVTCPFALNQTFFYNELPHSVVQAVHSSPLRPSRLLMRCDHNHLNNVPHWAAHVEVAGNSTADVSWPPTLTSLTFRSTQCGTQPAAFTDASRIAGLLR